MMSHKFVADLPRFLIPKMVRHHLTLFQFAKLSGFTTSAGIVAPSTLSTFSMSDSMSDSSTAMLFNQLLTHYYHSRHTVSIKV